MLRFLLMLLVVFLSGCASNTISLPGLSKPASPPLIFSELYLRGVFNWWEATPNYQFASTSNGWYVDVELIADGQPYDFRISDMSWTPEQSCGAKFPGQLVSVGSPTYLVCNPGLENLQIIPDKTGTYRFTLAKASAGEVSLVITKVK